ncbi:MAG: ABC transporter permease [Candidatus Odinarchaeota archaeon]
MNLGSLIIKEYRRIRSDKRSLALMFLVPVVIIVFFGLSTGATFASPYRIVVMTRDHLPQSTIFANGTLVADSHDYSNILVDIIDNRTESFELVEVYDSSLASALESAHEQIRLEEVDVAVTLSENFTESILYHQDLTLQLYIDGSDIKVREGITTAFQELLLLLISEIQSGDESFEGSEFVFHLPTLEYIVPSWENQVLNNVVPIVIPFIIISATMNLTSTVIITDEPLGRMLLTPMSKRDVILAKCIMYNIVGFIQSSIIFLMVYSFGLFVQGPVEYFYLAIVLTSVVGINIGLFISSLAPTEDMANQAYIGFLICSMVLSGNLVPPERFVTPLKAFGNFFPVIHARNIIVDLTFRKVVNVTAFGWLVFLSLGYVLLAYIFYRFKRYDV